MEILSRLVTGWPGLLMLVAPDRSVLALSASLAQLLGKNARSLGPLVCTRVAMCGEAQGCCLDFASGSDDISEPALALIPRPHASPLVVLTRVEPIGLPVGSRAYLVHLDPLTPLPGPESQFALDSLLSQLRTEHADRTGWLRLLSDQWIRPLVRPKWIGWLAEHDDAAAELLLSVGRLPKGATHEQIVAVAQAARRESPGNTSPFTLRLPAQLDPHALYVLPSCSCPGWLLLLLGGTHDAARIGLLHALTASALRVDLQAQLSQAGATNVFPAKPHGALTAREVEVLTLVAQGLADKRIAVVLDLSFHTVRNHLRNIMRKLGVGKRAQIAFALRLVAGDAVTSNAPNHTVPEPRRIS
ncbi:MAG: LuxR C-terminal-related transcriptional regulator [Pseudomonadota bacterium]